MSAVVSLALPMAAPAGLALARAAAPQGTPRAPRRRPRPRPLANLADAPDPAAATGMDEVAAVFELRLALEPPLLALAAQRRQRGDLQRLARALDRLGRCLATGLAGLGGGQGAAAAAHQDILLVLAAATRNPPLQAAVGSYLGAVLHWLHPRPAPAEASAPASADDLAQQAARASIQLRRLHQGLSEALAAVSRQDAPGASAAWRQLLQAQAATLRAHRHLLGLTAHAQP